MTILFVCTGNTCRSPMAAALMRARLHRRGIAAPVLSAGLTAGGEPIAHNAAAVLGEVGIDAARHRSRPLTREMWEAADVIAVMTADHRRLLLAAGVPKEKLRVLGGGIPDPFGGDMAVYRRCRETLQKAVTDLAEELFGPEKAPLDILPMKAEHIPALAALEKECFSDPWSEAALAEELCNPAARFTVAVMEGRVAGYLGFHHVLEEGAIADLAVSPAHRRQGVARALLAELTGWAAQNGVSRITLEVRASNAPAIALYEGAGFVRVGTRPGFYAHPTEDAYTYSLHIEVEQDEHTGL